VHLTVGDGSLGHSLQHLDRPSLGVATISADVTDETAAHRILAEVHPDILALNAGAKPRMGRLDQLSCAAERAIGIEPEAFLTRYGAPMPPRRFGDHLVAVLDDPQYATGFAFGLNGDTGITVLEGEAA
jgi:hypothetical protein